MEKLYEKYRRWSNPQEAKGDGIIVASDLSQEWLLPWWWENYCRFNSYPVTFIDLGMSKEKKQWCKQRGNLVFLPIADIFVAEKAEVTQSLAQAWENHYGSRFWANRNAWFKKPAACLQSAYERAIWIDLDCEVRGSLENLFALCETDVGVAIAEDKTIATQFGYNSGVIVFKKGSPLIELWADLAFDSNQFFAGDQDALSEIIQKQQLKITELPLIYNWSRCYEDNPAAIILHWHGVYGKSYIHYQLMKAQLFEGYDVT